MAGFLLLLPKKARGTTGESVEAHDRKTRDQSEMVARRET